MRVWSGPGFNMIWRPHKAGVVSGDTNTKDFFLEINVTEETLSFTDITGPDGVANRGLVQGDIALGALAYQQEVNDVTIVPPKALHFEPGVWACVPLTTDPDEPQTVTRMGSIPHGTTINAQGTALSSPNGKPHFTNVSIQPFTIGSPDDGTTGIAPFPEATTPLSTTFPSRTPLSDLVGLDDAHFENPILILSDIANAQNIIKTEIFIINTDVTVPNTSQDANTGSPNEGGGTDNIAFLAPNANAVRMSAIFWVETIKPSNGQEFLQLQYIQRVLLNFNGLSWPHVSCATMVVTSAS